jgi:hypothetical protein
MAILAIEIEPILLFHLSDDKKWIVLDVRFPNRESHDGERNNER